MSVYFCSMSENVYYEVIISKSVSAANLEELKESAFMFHCTGLEEFSLIEEEVDEILGERSYSGGNLPTEVLDEVNSIALERSEVGVKVYFSTLKDANEYKVYVFKKIGLELVVSEINSKDWNEEWRKHYSRIQITDDFAIVPEWEKESIKSDELYIYPGQGFGTGEHETTNLCLKSFVKFKDTLSSCDSVLDYGCGSGILGLAVLKFSQSANIVMYDIDDSALLNTQQNIELNEMKKESFKLLNAKEKNKIFDKYDVVFANILQNVLLSEADDILRNLKKGSLLIISGLLIGQESDVINKYQSLLPSLVHLETMSLNNWTCITFRQEQ